MLANELTTANADVPVANYRFTPTQDWFTFNIETWRALFPLITSSAPRVLEIGSWEGRSAVFLLTELCRDAGEIVCIDHFDLHGTEAGRERYDKINHNLSLTGKHFRILDQFSFPALMTLLVEEISSNAPGFDWIYVDGSHEADDTLLDGELAWRLARKGAIFIFDDYEWSTEPKESMHHPKRGIDAFMAVHEGEYRVLSGAGQYQKILQKTAEMRIGFLVKEKVETKSLERGLGWGIYVVYCIDPDYAMPAAVSIRSLLSHTDGRVTAYVISCGLTKDDKHSLRDSLPHHPDFTLQFLDPPKDSITHEYGALWGKLDLASIVPAERVLYLDADTLIRSDITWLWGIDLEDKSVAAAPDVGYPTGHANPGDGSSARYFNAGVLLMDLVKIRTRSAEIQEMARKGGKDRHFRDQDVLNDLFADDWMELSLRWNAQGLGTYADHHSEARNLLDKAGMNNPTIVHFTGPVHPSLEAVLNPWVQPYTAKPWGYAGAPDHPFAEEWWAVLEETTWKGYRSSKTGIENEIEKAKTMALKRFDDVVQSAWKVKSSH